MKIFILLLSTYAYASFSSHPRCADMTKENWKSNRDACDEQFKSDGPVGKSSAKKLCDCVADSIVNEMTCADIERYRTDEKFAKHTRKRIAKLCLHESINTQ